MLSRKRNHKSKTCKKYVNARYKKKGNFKKRTCKMRGG